VRRNALVVVFISCKKSYSQRASFCALRFVFKMQIGNHEES
jgi:hypothetical protein